MIIKPWILCSVMLPKKEGNYEVLIRMEFPNNEESFYTREAHFDGKKWERVMLEIDKIIRTIYGWKPNQS